MTASSQTCLLLAYLSKKEHTDSFCSIPINVDRVLDRSRSQMNSTVLPYSYKQRPKQAKEWVSSVSFIRLCLRPANLRPWGVLQKRSTVLQDNQVPVQTNHVGFKPPCLPVSIHLPLVAHLQQILALHYECFQFAGIYCDCWGGLFVARGR